MKTSAAILWSTTLACMLAGAPAFAQPSGLRLTEGNEGLSLRGADNGLHLRFSTQKLPATSMSDLPQESPSLTRSTLRADWPVFGYGLRTSLGLAWDTGSTARFSSQAAAPTPTPFVGFGWRSEPAHDSRWSLSAEVGTSVGHNRCNGMILNCAAVPPLGMSGDAGGNGLRLAPYVSFGATYSFDR